MQNKKAIEIIYADEIPIGIMKELFTFRDKVDAILNGVHRIIVYEDDQQKETYALFVNKEGTEMIQTRTALTSRDLDEFYLSIGSSLPEQFPHVLSPGQFPFVYLPMERQTMREYRYFIQPLPVSQMIQTLFVDPSLTRQVTERDRSTIFTDGSKAVQIPANQRSIHYHDPVSESNMAALTGSSLHHVIHFVNKHGGWNGRYILENYRKLYSHEETFMFRQYINEYPVYAEKGEMIGALDVDSHQNVITGYHRSLIQLDTSFSYQDVTVMSGLDLLEQLSEYDMFFEDIEDIYLGYQAKINDYHLTLSPKWIIKVSGREPVIFDAKWVEKEGEQNGLEKSEDDSHRSVPSSG